METVRALPGGVDVRIVKLVQLVPAASVTFPGKEITPAPLRVLRTTLTPPLGAGWVKHT